METKGKLQRLPYLFAKKQGVFVAEVEQNEAVGLYHLANTPLYVFAEVQRLLQRELHLHEVTATEFQHHLASAYQSQSSIFDAAEGMEEDMDLAQKILS